MILKAVRIVDSATGRMMTAYGVRGKNRARLWVSDITGMTNLEVEAEVERNEKARYLIEEADAALERASRGYDDN